MEEAVNDQEGEGATMAGGASQADTARIEEDYAAYLELNRATIEAAERHAASGDKLQIAIAGAALGLSITFVEQIAGPAPTHRWLLFIAWFALVAAIAMCFAGIRAAAYSYLRTKVVVDRNFQKYDRTVFDRIRVEQDRQVLRKIVLVLDVGGGALLIIGLVFLVMFARCNAGVQNDRNAERNEDHAAAADTGTQAAAGAGSAGEAEEVAAVSLREEAGA